MIFKDLIYHVKERAKRDSQSGSFDLEVKRAINNSAIFVGNTENKGAWRSKVQYRASVDTTVDQNYIIMPIDFDSPLRVWHEEYTSEHIIHILLEQDFRRFDRNPSIEQNPESCMFAPSRGVITQPSSASAITISSSATTADNTQNITIFGIVSGLPDSETIALNNDADVTGNKSFTRIDKVTKDASTTGRVTLVDSSANSLVVLPAGLLSNSVEYSILYMDPFPSSSISIYFDYYRKQYWMTNDYDTPILGDEFNEAIIQYALWILDGKEADLVRYQTIIRSLKNKYSITQGAEFIFSTDNYYSNRGRPFFMGGYYPRTRA